MKVCFLVGEIFAWGKYGGFGFLTREIGKELVKRGFRVYAVVPLGEGQEKKENLDGIVVYGYEGGNTRSMEDAIRACDADIFHSQEPNIATYVAQKIHPSAKHVVTFQDPRRVADWWNEFVYGNWQKRRAFPGMLRFESALNPFIRRAVRRADGLFCQARYITSLSRALYGLKSLPEFLPNPIDIPDVIGEKSTIPTVCFLARWDKRKRPERFIQLARSFPNVRFLMMGKVDNRILQRNVIPENLEVLGLTQGEEKAKILRQSWALINTSTRECLPVSFLEASAYECAIISMVNPDNFASDFGFHVVNDDYESAVRQLLKEGWQQRGRAGRKYIQRTHSIENSIGAHVAIYNSLLRK